MQAQDYVRWKLAVVIDIIYITGRKYIMIDPNKYIHFIGMYIDRITQTF